MEYILLAVALIVVVGLVLFLVSKLTPSNWGNLKGGLGSKYTKYTIGVIIGIVIVFVLLFLSQYFLNQ